MPSIYRRSGTVPISAFATITVLFIVSLIIMLFAMYWMWRFIQGPSTTGDPPDTSSTAIPATSPFSYLDQRPLASPMAIRTPSNPVKTTLQPSEPRRPPSPPRSRPSPPLNRPAPPQPRQNRPQPRPNPPPPRPIPTPANPAHPKSRPPTPPFRNPNRPPALPQMSPPAGLAHRQPSTAEEIAMAAYIHSLSSDQLNATARGDSSFFSASSLAASSIAGSEMSSLPTNAAFAAEFARREQRLRERGLVGRGWALVQSEGGSVGEGSLGDGGEGDGGQVVMTGAGAGRVGDGGGGGVSERGVVPRALDVRKGAGRMGRDEQL